MEAIIQRMQEVFSTAGSQSIELPQKALVGMKTHGKIPALEDLIPMINKLEEVVTLIGVQSIQLPQIAVVGTQSSGKSSVLEGIVGRSFLPRGVGIVTRCPLILELTYSPREDTRNRSRAQGTLEIEEFGLFSHKGNEVFKDFNEIRKEIDRETEKRTGSTKSISPKPIVLKLFSPHVVSLTLIDLPGLTKVPLDDQPADIEIQIRDLVLSYINNPNCIILAVATANTDMATNESIKLARECDPEGNRTLAVLTKLDLMDAGTDATDILCGKVIPVKLGIIGVVNRSQKDIQDGKSISESLKDEAIFLQKKYPTLANKNGTPYLANTLSILLTNHIRACLPDLKDRVNVMIMKFKKDLVALGDEIIDKNRTLLHLITKFSTTYCATVDGPENSLETAELSPGARICIIFHRKFVKALEGIDPLKGLSIQEILTALRNASGLRPAMFVPQISFELLAKRQIRQLLEPSLNCVELVQEEMRRAIRRCNSELGQELGRFPKLQQKIADTVTQLLKERHPITNQMVEKLIQMELSYINTNHPDFKKQSTVLKELFWVTSRPQDTTKQVDNIVAEPHLLSQGMATGPDNKNNVEQTSEHTSILNQKCGFALSKLHSINIFPATTSVNKEVLLSEELDCEVLKHLVEHYFCIVRKSITDHVPKAVMSSLVNFMKDNLLSELISRLYDSNDIEELLSEDDRVCKRRKETLIMLQCLETASGIINEAYESDSL